MVLTARLALILVICGLLLAPGPAAAAPRVVASIKPIHALVSAVMAGLGEPQLLMAASGSPHTFQLKPSGARLLQRADAIFWMGPTLETFLAKALRALPRNARVASLYDAPGVSLLTTDDRAIGQASGNGSEIDRRAANRRPAEIDMHAWLDPANARAMAAHIAATLIAVDPDHGSVYRANAEALDLRLAALDRNLNERLKSIDLLPFIVFHDAYRYFEKRYGLRHVAAITPSPHRQPGADRLRRIRELVKGLGTVCVFVEPQFRPTLIAVITEDNSARIEVLDPLGAKLEPGPDLYVDLLEELANRLVRCLTSAS
jgi:zinc transport system substrate-binding protein